MIAALFVLRDGPYHNIQGVSVWHEEKDARKYKGPYRVIAHPPCQRWGRYWSGGPSSKVKLKKGDDGGCFESALKSVRKYGGVLEHPADSAAWGHFELNKPPRSGGWIQADNKGGWTCCVYQGNYGHRAQKATWLYAVGIDLPELKWGSCGQRIRLDPGYHSAEERRLAKKKSVRRGITELLSKSDRVKTPIPFRNLLLKMVGYLLPIRHIL
jgi:hypothetical protein